MRKKDQANQIWLDICKNCRSHEEDFAGSCSSSFEDTFPLIQSCEDLSDSFNLALLAKDRKAIQKLYDTSSFSDKVYQKIKEMMVVNGELLLSLNPFILQDKYHFLESYFNEIALDSILEDKLLSLNDFELQLLERLVNYGNRYGIHSNLYLSTFIEKMGRSSIPGRNNEKHLEKLNHFFETLQENEDNFSFTDENIEIIGFIIKTGIYPTNFDDFLHYSENMKDYLKDQVNDEKLDIESCKKNILFFLFGADYYSLKFLIKNYNLEGLSKDLLLSPGVVELSTIKMILNCSDIEKLREVLSFIVEDKDFKLPLFQNTLIDESLLKVYAKEFNQCKPDFSSLLQMDEIDGVKFYDLGENFYCLAKTLGAFSSDGSGSLNYYEEWNNARYRSHINAISCIRNDNLAFSETDGKNHIKLGFSSFSEDMFLGGGVHDIDTAPSSRSMGSIIHSKLFLPHEFINHTRNWHNELDYERKDSDSNSIHFKKNPDYLILDLECEDFEKLDFDFQKKLEEYKKETIRAAKEFGNLPILVINREKIAKNERRLINEMMDDYQSSHDYTILQNIIIKFMNNRNGCRGNHHEYIRENYFSDSYFQDLLKKIDSMILESQKKEFQKLVEEECKEMAKCIYDYSATNLLGKLKNNEKEIEIHVY